MTKHTNAKMKTLVSVNITAHCEGDYLYRTLQSILRTVVHAKSKKDISIEINIGLDNADSLTTQIATDFAVNNKDIPIHIYNVKYGDLALHRNFLITKSKGEYIAFCDGDDLLSENYISEALKVSRGHKPAVYSVGWCVLFDDINPIKEVRRILPSDDPRFVPTNSYEYVAFLSQLFVHRDIYETYPYKPLGENYRSEDWNWYLTVLVAGYTFYTLPKALFCYRIKTQTESLSQIQVNTNRILEATPYFAPENFKNMPHKYYKDIDSEHLVSLPQQQNTVPLKGNNQTTGTFARIGKRLTKKIFDRSMPRLYTIIALQYRTLQQLFAPIIHKLRHNHLVHQVIPIQKTLVRIIFSRSELTVGDILIENSSSIGSEKYTLNRLESFGFTTDHLGYIKKLNDIEPCISFSSQSLANLMLRDNNFPSKIKDTYFDFCSKYDGKITDIILVPHLVQGGADLEVIQLVNSLASKGRNVLVLTDENRPSTWGNKINLIPGAIFLERYKDLTNLNEIDFKVFLIRILQNWNIRTFTISNSLQGYLLLDEYGEVIRQHTKLIVLGYCFSMNDMFMRDYVFPLSRIYHKIDLFITDGGQYRQELMATYGWSGDKITTVYQPINNKIKKISDHPVTNKIVYAGRLCEQKQTDLLLNLAKMLEKDGIHIDIYGSKDDIYCRQIKFDQRVDKLSNVFYHGSFNDFSALPLQRFDLLILPTLHEGMPNIVLESVKANLFVVAGNVGSIPEIINSGVNGILVSQNGDVGAYRNAIKRFYSSVAMQDYNLRSKTNAHILTRHSQENYESQVNKLYNT